MPTEYIIALLATGTGVGFAQGLLGVGGCFIMVPVTTIVFIHMGIPLDTAVKLAFGTNLLVVFFTAISSSTAHHRRGAVWWRAAIVLGLAVGAGALLGSTITSRFISGEVIKVVFGAAVIFAGIWMLTAKPAEVEEEPKDSPTLWAGCGFPLGVISGLIAIGGGIFMVPILNTLLKFKMHRAVGTSTAVLMFSGAAGALGYTLNGLHASNLPAYSVGYVNLVAFGCLVSTSIAMAQVGARTAHRLPAKTLRLIFIIVMFYMGLKMLGVVP
jgi:hypothetical protein